MLTNKRWIYFVNLILKKYKEKVFMNNNNMVKFPQVHREMNFSQYRSFAITSQKSRSDHIMVDFQNKNGQRSVVNRVFGSLRKFGRSRERKIQKSIYVWVWPLRDSKVYQPTQPRWRPMIGPDVMWKRPIDFVIYNTVARCSFEAFERNVACFATSREHVRISDII